MLQNRGLKLRESRRWCLTEMLDGIASIRLASQQPDGPD
jgi:hypothetical protein